MLGIEPRRLKERLIGSTIAVGVARNNFLFPLLNEVFDQLISGGIPQHLKKFHDERLMYVRRVRAQKNETIKDSFTMDDLDYGFKIWIITCGVSSLVFLLEFLVVYLKFLLSCIRNLIGLYFVALFLKKYVK